VVECKYIALSPLLWQPNLSFWLLLHTIANDTIVSHSQRSVNRGCGVSPHDKRKANEGVEVGFTCGSAPLSRHGSLLLKYVITLCVGDLCNSEIYPLLTSYVTTTIAICLG
jgi:hypothetical protein